MTHGTAGGCTVSITPASPLKGYFGVEFSRNEEEDSDVLAHAVVFSDGRTEAALVSVDLTAVDRNVVLSIRELCQLECGIPAGNVFVAANHVHAAPHAAPMFQFGAQPDPLYIDFLVRRVVRAVVTAKSSRSAMCAQTQLRYGSTFRTSFSRALRPPLEVLAGSIHWE